MKMNFDVETDTGGWNVTSDGRDIRAWELATGKSFFAETQDLTYTVMCRLAHFASQRLGLFSGNWAEFDASCVGVSQAETIEANPTQSAGGGNSSSPSLLRQESPTPSGTPTLPPRSPQPV